MKTGSIGIIGMGWVGASVAISILQRGLCRKLLLNDVRQDIAEGEAMDLNHGSSFYPAAEVYSTDIEQMTKCDAIVVTAGKGGTPGQSRLDLLKDNMAVVKGISDQLKGFNGMLIIVANPVDVLTYYYQKFTGLPTNKVIGTGTMLDTSRLRSFVAQKAGVDPKSVHAHVLGEHGDSEVTLWSRAMIGGISLRHWRTWNKDYEPEITDKIRGAAHEIIKRKGATNHAIGLVTATLLKWILNGERRLVNVSSSLSGIYNLKDVAMSVPTLISEDGVSELLEMRMSDDEYTDLMHSADILKKAINSVS